MKEPRYVPQGMCRSSLNLFHANLGHHACSSMNVFDAKWGPLVLPTRCVLVFNDKKKKIIKISAVVSGDEHTSYIQKILSEYFIFTCAPCGYFAAATLDGAACPEGSATEHTGCRCASYMMRFSGCNMVRRYIASIPIALMSTFIVRWVLPDF